MSIASAFIRNVTEESDTMPEETNPPCASPLNDREINNIYHELRSIRTLQDTHFRTLVGYIILAALSCVGVISGFGLSILARMH